MIQPRKDEFRRWLQEARADLRIERGLRAAAEQELVRAKEVLGALVLSGQIAVPAHKLGELVLQMAAEQEALALADD